MAEAGTVALSRYLSPDGAARMRAELTDLRLVERPKIVEIVSWAAGNGDRSENGDYIYGKRRLREIDRRIRFLSKRLDQAVIVDPAAQSLRDRVFFGATVAYVDEDDAEHRVTILGCDEVDTASGQISLVSPLARALLRTRVGDEVTVNTPGGARVLEILSIGYP
ncbi:transcription elongation factor GreB [Acidomonas methanolica]|uniref:Transcription elongation factor GreB n=1 Tax=Acidomonas methanolica NBRC 104435 TaxID=1231351 RepID=A0A023D3N3_ACIMT|nr:transcription elongation factor GreB [Acidomonas methanolica]TCS31516.1 transcription elongation factor GreB [Acidomonas methanolica]GAJ28727.1 transcription elongation factor GreA/GreB [Acidomonas methanolica NBRC 104435]GBQ47614.1 transcription elongation factor GreB [Acidomonas methanolica]GEK97935.1 transcription elongation factor GreB [Acidomonas methanolica NBRC 104435]